MPTALIAEDEPMLKAQLKARLAEAWPELAIVAEAENGEEAVMLAKEEQPDVAFLDIRMPLLTGLDVAKAIAGGPHVVFVTAYDEYAVAAFEEGAVDYLLKPPTPERIAKVVARLKARLGTPPVDLAALLERLAAREVPGATLKWVRASLGTAMRMIAIDDVLYFQAQDKYTCVITREGEYLIRTALSELSKQLDAALFAQVHRSTVVNMNVVASTRRDLGGRLFVRLKDGKRTELPVSRAYAHLFRQM